MKICLVYPNQIKLPKFFENVSNIPNEPLLLPPLGMLYTWSNNMVKMDFLDNRVHGYDGKHLYAILSKYDLVAFGGTIFEVEEAINISQMLQKEDITTVYGGPNATINWELYTPYFDIIARGEGEGLFDEIIENFNNLSKVKGLVYKENGKTRINEPRPFIENLDALKFPAREKVNFNDYMRHAEEYTTKYPVDTIVSSRGCPYNCYFCSSKWIWGGKYRYRSVDNVIEEMCHMREKLKTKVFYFREDGFTIHKKRLLEFCEKVKNLDMPWLCESRTDALDKEVLKKMEAANCSGIWFGIESCSQRTLNLIKKQLNLEKSKNIITECKETGIKTSGGFMIGFPHETKEDMLWTGKKSKQLGLDYVFYNRVWAIPKSEMYSQIKEEKLDEYEHANIVIPRTRYVSADEVTNIYYKIAHPFLTRMLLKLLSKFPTWVKKGVINAAFSKKIYLILKKFERSE
jgi:radical SAM superfamily enzyme YgiQ (UPF0313 family)